MNTVAETISPAAMVTADGTPLKVSLARARRRARNRALLLVAPLFLFIFITFLVPIFSMLFRSVENDIVGDSLHRTVPLLQNWDESTGELPDEEVYAALLHLHGGLIGVSPLPF